MPNPSLSHGCISCGCAIMILGFVLPIAIVLLLALAGMVAG